MLTGFFEGLGKGLVKGLVVYLLLGDYYIGLVYFKAVFKGDGDSPLLL